MHLAGCIFFSLNGYWLSLCGFAANAVLQVQLVLLVQLVQLALLAKLVLSRLIAFRLSPPFREGLGVGSHRLLMMIRLAAEDGHGAIDLLDEEKTHHLV